MEGTLRSRKVGSSLELKHNVNRKENIFFGKNYGNQAHDSNKNAYVMHLSEEIWSFVMLLFCTMLFCIVYSSLNQLPQPKSIENAKQEDFIEEKARYHLNKLVGFGHRPAGSYANDVYAVEHILQTVKNLEKLSTTLKFEVDVQHPTGSFTLPFLTGFASFYSNISNTIVKISPITGNSKHALLLNCHTDTAFGAPGASDDAVACAVLLEIMRALVVEEQQHSLLHPIIFLFNGAEENILQGSHGFITNHPWAKEIKAFINLEAAGAGGKEIVFQTGPSNPWLAMAWAAHAPHPFATVVAEELFQTGVLPAETDFRIFRDYGNIPGIDLAYMRNGYVYHTTYDNVEMIQPGSIQRAGDNILAVVKHLVKSKSSLLPDPKMYSHGATAYMDILGLYMLIIPIRLLTILNWACSVGGMLFIIRRVIFATDRGYSVYGKQIIKAVGVIILTWVVCFASLIFVSILLTGFGKSMTFYAKPYFVILLYVVPGFLSVVAVHRIAKSFMFKNEGPWHMENIFFDAHVFVWSAILFQANYLQLHSSLILFLCAAPILLVRCIFCKNLYASNSESVPLQKFLLYLVAVFPHSLIVMSHGVLFLELLIPLCNRTGSDAPPDLLIALVIGLFVCLFSHFTISTVYTVKFFKWFMHGLLLLCLVAFIFACTNFGFPFSFEPSKPITKRLYIQHAERKFYEGTDKLISNDSGLWVNTMDYAGFNIDMGSEILSQSPLTPCSGMFCHFPWLMPLHNLIRNSKYIPANSPINTTIYSISDPLLVKVVKDELTLIFDNSTTSIYKKHLSFVIRGPSHMSIQIGTLASKSFVSKLARWSLNGSPDSVKTIPLSNPSDKNFTYNDWYFIYYGSGLSTLPWQPWFEFLIYHDKIEHPYPLKFTVEFGFAAQHYVNDFNIPLPSQTKDIHILVNDLYDWVMHISWISTYKNYLF